MRSLSDFKVEMLRRQLDVQVWILGDRLDLRYKFGINFEIISILLILKPMGWVQMKNRDVRTEVQRLGPWSPPLFPVWEDERLAKEVEKECNEVEEAADCVYWGLNKKSVLRRKEGSTKPFAADRSGRMRTELAAVI